MSEWVAVCADEAEEPVEIPTEADGELASVKFQPFLENQVAAMLAYTIRHILCSMAVCRLICARTRTAAAANGSRTRH